MPGDASTTAPVVGSMRRCRNAWLSRPSDTQRGATGSNAAAVDLSWIGLGYYSGGPSYSYAYFDEVRLSNVCLYSENFSPPAAPFTLPSGVW